MLEFFFSLYGIFDVVCLFKVDQFMYLIFLGKPFYHVMLMFVSPANQVIGHANIKRPMLFGSQYVDKVILHDAEFIMNKSSVSIPRCHSCEVAKRRSENPSCGRRGPSARKTRCVFSEVGWELATTQGKTGHGLAANTLNPRGGIAATRAWLRAAAPPAACGCEVALPRDPLDSRADAQE
jgi:hypothetical protein